MPDVGLPSQHQSRASVAQTVRSGSPLDAGRPGALLYDLIQRFVADHASVLSHKADSMLLSVKYRRPGLLQIELQEVRCGLSDRNYAVLRAFSVPDRDPSVMEIDVV